LNELGVDYNFTDVDLLTGEDRKTAINEVRQYNPQVSFPTILIGDKVIVGNKENEIKEALGL
jgi:glutaredoxin